MTIQEQYDNLEKTVRAYNPAADFQPTPHMTGKRYPLEHTCFWNQVPQDRSVSPVLKERV